ncbi:MAG: putative prephenate dehydrogenase [Actinomycetota bacterium]
MNQRRANVFGLGLIGGSLAAALTSRGWHVTGSDMASSIEEEALHLGLIAARGVDADAEISFVATPVSSVADQVRKALSSTSGLVTDVGGVKASIVNEIHDPRFIAGHPMAGSELIGLAGADAALFEGAVWVLTPTAQTPDENFASIAQIVKELGAEFVVLSAERHDQLVAIVSHLPHLTAATLMSLANEHSEEHVAVLRLAAGGFRDMTRVASGHPAIWLDVCKENREAIVGALDGMISGLQSMRDIVDSGKSDELLQRLQTARVARSNLPGRVRELLDVVEVRVPIPDRSGAAAEIFSLAAELGVNTANFEVAHSVEGDRGILVLVIDRASQDVFKGGLIARGFRPSIQNIS